MTDEVAAWQRFIWTYGRGTLRRDGSCTCSVVPYLHKHGRRGGVLLRRDWPANG